MERNKRLTVKEVIAELLKCNPDAEVIAESPYRDRFKVYTVTESDCKTVVWLEA
jgi:hypothetical protein